MVPDRTSLPLPINLFSNHWEILVLHYLSSSANPLKFPRHKSSLRLPWPHIPPITQHRIGKGGFVAFESKARTGF